MKYIYQGTIEIETEADHRDIAREKAIAFAESKGLKLIELKQNQKRRTLIQTSALYLYFSFLSDELNEAGQDMKKVIRKEIDIPWTPENVKLFLWKPIMEAYLNKISTTQLTTEDINKCYDILNKVIGERTGVHVDFPSIESLVK